MTEEEWARERLGRVQFRGPEANIGDLIQKLSSGGAGTATPGALPAWQQALQTVKLPLSDADWEPAVILDKAGAKLGDDIRFGIRDGRVLPLNAGAKRNLALYDVVHVRLIEGRPKLRIEIRQKIAQRAAKGQTPYATSHVA
jgi:hypothetical protein